MNSSQERIIKKDGENEREEGKKGEGRGRKGREFRIDFRVWLGQKVAYVTVISILCVENYGTETHAR